MEAVMIILIAIIMALCLLLRLIIVKRRVIVTIVKNLPIGIFRDKNKSYQTENKVYIKEISKINNEEKCKLDETYNYDDNQQEEEIESINETENNSNLVYWTPNGKTYHMSTTCFALSRSKVINQGTIDESGKSTLCDLCKESI